MRGALMVCGTSSNVGKSHVVTGLCRLLARQGVRVAPFKSQNMALNSFVTPQGHEIGRAQGVQALAAGVEPEVDMNPILLKPTGERTSQVVIRGVPAGHLDAAEYQVRKPELLDVVLASLERLRSSFDVVVLEGAGSPAEINLLEHDIVNLRVAAAVGAPAVLVGDIDRGGVFASLYGTLALLPDELRGLIRGFVINKLRGDPLLLAPGLSELERRTGVATLGVVPWTEGLDLDAEDSLALDQPRSPAGEALGDSLDVAVLRFPRLSNFTDLDAFDIEPGVAVRYVDRAAALGDPDLVILPGSKATVADLEWLRARNFPAALERCSTVLGICGGYQMLGEWIEDQIEVDRGRVPGLGRLPVTTTFETAKTTRQRRGHAMGQRVSGYEIHHGHVERTPGLSGWLHLDDGYGAGDDGCATLDGSVLGTTLHGLFESDGLRSAFLTEIGRRREKTFVPAGISFSARREAQSDRLADLLAAHLDLHRVWDLLDGAGRRPTGTTTTS